MRDEQVTHPKQLEKYFDYAKKYADSSYWTEYMHFVNTIGSMEGTKRFDKRLYIYDDDDFCYLYNHEGLIMCDIIFKKPQDWDSAQKLRLHIAKEHNKTATIYDIGNDKDINKKWHNDIYKKDKDMSITFIAGVNYTYTSDILNVDDYYCSSSHLDRDIRRAVRLIYPNETLEITKITDTRHHIKVSEDITLDVCHISELDERQIYEQVELAKVWKATKTNNGYQGIIGSSAFLIERLTNGTWKFSNKDFSKKIPFYIIDLRYRGILVTTHQFTRLNETISTLPGYKPIMFSKGIVTNQPPPKIIRAVSNLKYYTVIRVIEELFGDTNFILSDMSGGYSLTKESIYNNTYLENMSWRKQLDDFKTKHKPLRIVKQWKAHPKKEINLIKESASKNVSKRHSIF